jgi:hypothetical protein
MGSFWVYYRHNMQYNDHLLVAPRTAAQPNKHLGIFPPRLKQKNTTQILSNIQLYKEQTFNHSFDILPFTRILFR